VSIEPAVNRQPFQVVLDPATDYTATVDVEGLEPGIDYIVHAVFAPSEFHVRGRLCTMRKSDEGDPDAFSFVLSSCNLSIVSINDFLSFLAASGGISLARSSLRLPFHRWKRPRIDWLKRLIRFLLDTAIKALAFFVNLFTDIKQPGPPLLRSPFLKLSAVFESVVLKVVLPSVPRPSDEVAAQPEPPFIAVGDRVNSSGRATGVVASLGDVVKEEVPLDAAHAGKPGGTSKMTTRDVRRLVLTQVEGSFKRGSVLFRQVTSNSHERLDRLGTIAEAAAGRPWFEPPSFFMHAGDQIYFDFPSPGRCPSRVEYRLAYREAWFEDDALRHVLTQWPHYMTLDDHEIADQFARDFKPPNRLFSPTEYLHEASRAYREYANALSPPQENGQPKNGPYWYTFNKRKTRFFVLDTRTQRHNGRGEIIDREQMQHLLAWMKEHPLDLKFVVTSVPFVAEVNEETSDQKEDWFKNKVSPAERSAANGGHADAQSPGRNPEQDKWSALAFKRQRDAIIENIAASRIEHVVFLTGDMHCCYHATMRIGCGLKKYESVTVHELAGGPVNQLQLARAHDFDCRSVKRTACGVDYEVTLDRFHSEVSAVMHVKVEHKRRRQVFGKGTEIVPEVEWNVIRTLTDPGPDGWRTGAAGQRSLDLPVSGPPIGESVMAGRISFVQKRSPEDLEEWPTIYTTATPNRR
jgi:phosphodiesterase/alkaline phosphatase D-like protein